MKTKAAIPFASGREHLVAELAWLDRCLALQVRLFHRELGNESGHGWFLSRREIESLVETAPATEPEESVQARVEILQSRRELDARKQAGVKKGAFLPLAFIAGVFRLSRHRRTGAARDLGRRTRQQIQQAVRVSTGRRHPQVAQPRPGLSIRPDCRPERAGPSWHVQPGSAFVLLATCPRDRRSGAADTPVVAAPRR